jgi:NAD(P)-dependent dehydrogenase (short-subunit alcohol dehydrogenase family)
MDVNLRGTFFFTQAVVRHMLATEVVHPRSIVTVSSVNAQTPYVKRAEYCISMSGLGMLTRLFARGLAPYRIGVFEVRPGIFHAKSHTNASTIHALGETELGNGSPADVAQAVATLVEGKLGYCTGSVVQLDGGHSLK